MSEPRPIEEAARFSSFPEAQVACSALKAAGIDAVLIDSDPVIGAWREPYGSGGFRLGAPADQVVQARALLRQFDQAHEAAAPARASRLADAPRADRMGVARLVLIGGLFIAIAAAAVLSRL